MSSFVACKETLRHVNVSDNWGVNGAIPELCKMLESCQKLAYLNISDLNLKTKYFVEVAKAMMLNEGLEELIWNYDLAKSSSTAMEVITLLSNKYKNRSNKL